MLPELPLPRKPPALNKGGRFSRMGSVFDEEAPGEAAQPQQVTRVIVEKILGASAVGLIFFFAVERTGTAERKDHADAGETIAFAKGLSRSSINTTLMHNVKHTISDL